MLVKQGGKIIQGLILFLIVLPLFAEEKNNSPCDPSQVISLTDRGSALFSPCALPNKKVLFEGGYQYNRNPGWLHTFPQGHFRVGLPYDTEIGLFPPNYNVSDQSPAEGASAFAFDLKHQLAYDKKWIMTAVVTVIAPGGSSGFGSSGVGVFLSPMFEYNLTEKWSITAMYGIGSLTQPNSKGGRRYFTSSPDVLLTYSPTKSLNLFAEAYSISPTGPHQKSAVYTDVGLLYEITKKLALDIGGYYQWTNNSNVYKYFLLTGLSYYP